MNLYIIETIIFLILAILSIAILKLKKMHKIGLIIAILVIIFIGSETTTYILEKPKINVSNQTIQLEAKENGTIEIPTTTYHMKNVTSSVKVVGDIDYNKVGEYKVQYEVPTITGSYKVEQNVKIVDTTAPNITLKGNTEYDQSYKEKYKEPGYTAEDNCDGELTEKVKVEHEKINEEEYNIVYSVEDNSGNVTTTKRKIHIIDNISPEIKLKGAQKEKIILNSTYKEKGATAKDEKDGDLSKDIKISGNVNTSKEGTYKIKYTVSDKSGNKTTKTREITVYKEEIKKKPVTNTSPKKNTKTEEKKIKTSEKNTKVTEKKTTTKTTSNQSNSKGVIYLTFDDGPSKNITPKILDILKKKNVKATFFILNYSSSLEYLVKREHNEGHTVAIHGYSHDYGKIYKSEEAFMNNITKLQKKIKKTIGVSPTIIRFPGGSSNTVSRKYNKGIMTRLTKKVIANGYRYFDWNVSSEDAGGARTSTQVYNNVTKNLKKNRANVVLMHDFGGNTKTLNALSKIIDYGLKNGYTFKAITTSTPMVKHGVNN